MGYEERPAWCLPVLGAGRRITRAKRLLASKRRPAQVLAQKRMSKEICPVNPSDRSEIKWLLHGEKLRQSSNSAGHGPIRRSCLSALQGEMHRHGPDGLMNVVASLLESKDFCVT